MKVDMLSTLDDGGQENIGSFVLKGGKVEIVCPPKYRGELESILRRKLRDKSNKRYGVEQGASRWLRLMPLNYDGCRLRAALTE